VAEQVKDNVHLKESDTTSPKDALVFDVLFKTDTSIENVDLRLLSPKEVIINAVEDQRTATSRIPTEKLYPSLEPGASEFRTAIALLGEAVTRINQARDAFRSKDPISSDNNIIRMQTLLPELFALRILGDGFGTIVSSVICAFQNLEGSPLSLDQISSLQEVFSRLREEPFLTIDQASDLTDDLEKANFLIYPKQIGLINDIFEEESLS